MRLILYASVVASASKSPTDKSSELIERVGSATSTPNGSLRMGVEWFLKSMARTISRLSWQADMRRERAVVIGGANVLRATSIEVRVEPKQLINDLLAIGVPELSEPG